MSLVFSSTTNKFYTPDDENRIVATIAPTHGAVRSHPVGVTAAEAGVWYERPMAVALVRALGPGQLAVQPPPARLAVALPVHADAVVGARRVQAIHCEKQDKERYEKKKNTKHTLNYNRKKQEKNQS